MCVKQSCEYHDHGSNSSALHPRRCVTPLPKSHRPSLAASTIPSLAACRAPECPATAGALRTRRRLRPGAASPPTASLQTTPPRRRPPTQPPRPRAVRLRRIAGPAPPARRPPPPPAVAGRVHRSSRAGGRAGARPTGRPARAVPCSKTRGDQGRLMLREPHCTTIRGDQGHRLGGSNGLG